MPLCKHLDIHGRATRSKIWYQKFRVDNEALYDIYIYKIYISLKCKYYISTQDHQKKNTMYKTITLHYTHSRVQLRL